MRCSLIIALLLAAGAGAGANPPASTGTLTVKLTGLRSDRGTALIGLYSNGNGFPSADRAIAGGAAPIRNRTATLRFEAVPTGRVAVAVFHDEDRNGKLKRGLFNRPKEGYGFSRNARARFGPPDFDDAAITVNRGEHKAIEIRISYP